MTSKIFMAQSKTAPPSRANAPRLSDGQFGFILVLPALILFVAIVLYPLLNSMVMGFLDKSLVMPGETFVGLKNINRTLSQDALPLLRRTFAYTSLATVLPFLVGFALALILNYPLRGRGVLRGLFLFPWLVPSVVVSFLWMWIFNANYGVLNGLLRQLGLIAENINWFGDGTTAMIAVVIAKTWNTFPWITLMLLAGLQTIPRELYEAASIDGANQWKRFSNITIPQLSGIIGTVLLLSFIWNFQHFETIYVMTEGGPAKATTTFAIAVYDAAFNAYNLGKAGAIGIVWMAILSVVVAIYLRLTTKAGR